MAIKKNTPENFWDRVIRKGPDDCWIWTGYAFNGYGAISWYQKRLRTHVVAYMLIHGFKPTNPQCVMHTCDVRYAPGDLTYRRCCNPTHLTLGTRAENQRHMAECGRSASGQRHHFNTKPETRTVGTKNKMAKLNEEQVRAIRQITGISNVKISRLYGVTASTIDNIRNGTRWKHVQ